MYWLVLLNISLTANDMHSNCPQPAFSNDIQKYGLSVVVVEATDYLPSFAYSIGLWQTHKHPEIIMFGLSNKTMLAVVNLVADIVKQGQPIELDKEYGYFFESSKTQFLKVHTQNIKDYFGYAIDFYKTKDFPALQLIWTDRNDQYPWKTDFEEAFEYKQPLLDRNVDFKFREPKNLATFTTRQWLDSNDPILQVIHDEDGDWQFLTGNQSSEDAIIVALEQLVIKDITLNEVFYLGYGQSAERDFIGAPWQVCKIDS
jgi:hypothetical protein